MSKSREGETLLSSEFQAKLIKDIHAAKVWLVFDLRKLPTYLSKKMSTLLTLSKEGATVHLKLYSVVLSFHNDFVRTKCRLFYQDKLHFKFYENKRDSYLT